LLSSFQAFESLNPAIALVATSQNHRSQRTIKSPVEFRGVGLHSGKDVKLVVKPAEPGHGIVFVRTDLEGKPELPALCSHLKPRDRRSVLKNGLAEVHTVEHLLGSFWAMQIDNAVVEINGEEVPGLDGSALEFVQALTKAGISEQKIDRKCFDLAEPLYVSEGDTSLVALPGQGGLSIENKKREYLRMKE
jgi:UDP-3-O-acyl-N-acetylglucosamine deacetylase